MVEPADIEDLCLLMLQARARRIPVFVLGGTNLLIRDGGIRGIVVSLARLREIKEEPGSVLYAEGGVGMPTLIGYAIRHSLAGLEWAAGIPGTVAGCVVMNAGTKLGEMKDSVKALRLVNVKGQVVDFEEEGGRMIVTRRSADDPVEAVYGILPLARSTDELVSELRGGDAAGA